MKLSMIAWREERGVSAVIVAVAMIAIFGAAMLSVDAGNLWQTRRNAVTSTDAGALRAARDVATIVSLAGGADCGPNWLSQLNANTATDATQPQMTCQAFHPVNAETGYVTVAGTLLSQAKFGQVLGIGDQRPFSSTSVAFGHVPGIKGLRPLGVCKNNHHVQEWLQYRAGTLSETDYNNLAINEPLDDIGRIAHPIYPTLPTKVIHRIWFDKSPAEVNDCPAEDGTTTTPGNWGFMDYDGGNNSTNELIEWFLEGYDDVVTIGDCDSNGDTGDACEGNPGFAGGAGSSCPTNPGSLNAALNCLKDKEFPIMLYSEADCPTNGQGGGGGNCAFDAWQFLVVILRGWNLGAAGITTLTYFDLEFTDSIVQGPCCLASAQNADTGIKGIKICSVDHDPGDVSLHCTPT